MLDLSKPIQPQLDPESMELMVPPQTKAEYEALMRRLRIKQ